jgi:hypothetical protein
MAPINLKKFVESYATELKGGHSQSCRLGLEQSGHIFDTKDMNSLGDELIDKIQVVFQSILGFFRVGDVTAVADYSFANATSLLRGIYTEFHLET